MSNSPAILRPAFAPEKLNLAIGISFGVNAGYAINPARDLGPRLFAWPQGWGKIAFPGDRPFVYDLLIRNVLIARGVKPDPEMVEEVHTTIEED